MTIADLAYRIDDTIRRVTDPRDHDLLNDAHVEAEAEALPDGRFDLHIRVDISPTFPIVDLSAEWHSFALVREGVA